MNKRSKELFTMATHAGLKVISHGVGTKGRPTVRVTAPDGTETEFSLAQSAGDYHGDKNELARMKRFAKEHPAAAEPAPVATVKAPPPKFKPAGTFIPAPVVARAPAAPALTPAPAPIAAPAPVPATAPAPATVSYIHPTAKTMNTATKTAIRLNRPEFHKLTKFVESIDVTTFPKMQSLADAATEKLGFTVTHGHVREALEVLEIDHFKRKPADATAAALELATANSLQLLALLEAVGEQPLPGFVAALRTAGIAFTPFNARKTA